MSRLIDADSLFAKIDGLGITTGYDIKEMIKSQPTAFDVDDVTKKIREEIDKCNIKLNENPNTVNMLALCERRKALREALWYVNKDVMV